MIKLFIDMDNPSIFHRVYWCEAFDCFYTNSDGTASYIDDIYEYSGNMLTTQRPDGSWYQMYFWGVVDVNHREFYELLQSGLEPYQAFELFAL